MAAERYDDYDQLEHMVLKAKHRVELKEKLTLFTNAGGQIDRIGHLTFEDLRDRWNNRHMNRPKKQNGRPTPVKYDW
jgi:hypothetical protein